MANMALSKVKFATVNMIGYRVQVQTTNGNVFEGIFQAGSVIPGKEVGVVLGHAYKKEGVDPKAPFAGPPAAANRDTVIKQLVIKDDDVAQIAVVGVDLSYKAAPPDGIDSFSDTGISGGYGQVRERELKAWTPSAEDEALTATLGGPSAQSQQAGVNWTPEEMFAKNARDHNYKSEYNEFDYTTKINTSDPKYRQRMQQAERLAAGIVGGSTVGVNPHVLEDRGIDVGMDDAKLYSDVQRNPNAYVPPSQRKATAAADGGNPPAKGAGPPGLSSTPGAKPAGAAPAKNAWAARASAEENKPKSSAPAAGRKNSKGGAPAKVNRDQTTSDLKQFKDTFKLGTAADAKPAAAKPAEKETKLNPEAKAFSFNPTAKAWAPPAPQPAQAPVPMQMPGPGMMMMQQGMRPQMMYRVVQGPDGNPVQMMVPGQGFAPQGQFNGQQFAMPNQPVRMMIPQGYAPQPGMQVNSQMMMQQQQQAMQQQQQAMQQAMQQQAAAAAHGGVPPQQGGAPAAAPPESK